MPTYEYECSKCGDIFEFQQKISDPPRKRCPRCRGKVNRLISGGGGVILRGSGFYATDYRSPEYQKSAEADKPKAKGDASKPKKKESRKDKKKDR